MSETCDDPVDLHSTFDARVWAGAFCRIVGEKIPGIAAEQEWMFGWFANAIMAGYDEANRRAEKRNAEQAAQIDPSSAG